MTYSAWRTAPTGATGPGIQVAFVVDYDLNDTSTGDQGLVVFQPSLTASVATNTWQTWDATGSTGKWYGTMSTVTRHDSVVANPCVISSPCTAAHFMTYFPQSGVHATLGAVLLTTPPGVAGFDGNVDQLTISVGGQATTFDFEATAPVPAGTFVVSPGNMRGWSFVDESTNGACSAVLCGLVQGPNAPPLGAGSAHLATTSATSTALVLHAYSGMPFNHIFAISYSTYRSAPAGATGPGVQLAFTIDYDLTDTTKSDQGRIVFQPSLNGANPVGHVAVVGCVSGDVVRHGLDRPAPRLARDESVCCVESVHGGAVPWVFPARRGASDAGCGVSGDGDWRRGV